MQLVTRDVLNSLSLEPEKTYEFCGLVNIEIILTKKQMGNAQQWYVAKITKKKKKRDELQKKMDFKKTKK